MKKQIVIAQRGWVFIGDVSYTGTNVIINNAKNIRRWGTTKGLGELAINGPTSTTIVDDYGTITLHVLSIVAIVDVTSDKWNQAGPITSSHE